MIGRISALLAAALLAATPASPAELTAADVESWLNGLMNYGLTNGDIAGAVAVVVKDGKVLFQSGYGYADVAGKIPMDPEKVMTRIGSTSKLFTWTAVMQLVEQGKLDLNRNVDDYLDFKVSAPGGKPITLLDLMNHRGGFEEGLKDIFALDPSRLQSQQVYLKQHPRPLLFPTGTVPAYSNYGTSLAGYIVERVSGEPYSRYIENHILRPLGMAHSTFDQPLPERFKGQAALGYRTASQAAQPYELIATPAAGSAATTASDMARFMLAHLQQSDLLKNDTVQLMHSPSEVGLPGFSTMAHGFFYETRNGRILIGHGGDTLFFHTEMQLLPREGVGIFYSFNSRGREDAVYGLRKAVLDQFMDRYFPASTPAQEAVALPTAPADAQKIAGRYESSRRVQHGFLSIFYLLQQTVISANPDGTVSAPKFLEPGEAQFREVAPHTWQEVGGHRRLALQNVNGVNTVVESDDPTSVLQLVPTRRSAALNLTVLVGSLAVLLAAVILWPISFLVRRHYQRSPSDGRKLRTLLRAAALFDLLWLVAWCIVLTPVLSIQLDFYSAALDPVIRTLQLAGVVVVALAAVGIGCLWRLWSAVSWPARIGNGLIAAGLVGLVWIGVIGGLISFNLNY
ncbi:MAG: beta-lactamase family protein [Proteobacteria bacterium]|nr:beta-lactamase family protein [Pseudomonadota bacterium]